MLSSLPRIQSFTFGLRPSFRTGFRTGFHTGFHTGFYIGFHTKFHIGFRTDLVKSAGLDFFIVLFQADPPRAHRLKGVGESAALLGGHLCRDWQSADSHWRQDLSWRQLRQRLGQSL